MRRPFCIYKMQLALFSILDTKIYWPWLLTHLSSIHLDLLNFDPSSAEIVSEGAGSATGVARLPYPWGSGQYCRFWSLKWTVKCFIEQGSDGTFPKTAIFPAVCQFHPYFRLLQKSREECLERGIINPMVIKFCPTWRIFHPFIELKSTSDVLPGQMLCHYSGHSLLMPGKSYRSINKKAKQKGELQFRRQCKQLSLHELWCILLHFQFFCVTNYSSFQLLRQVHAGANMALGGKNQGLISNSAQLPALEDPYEQKLVALRLWIALRWAALILITIYTAHIFKVETVKIQLAVFWDPFRARRS